MENELCIYCQKNPIEIKTREMCRPCYIFIRSNGGLPPKPPKKKDEVFKTKVSGLAKRFGEEILTDFEDTNKKQYWDLVDIARKYGLSREYARQIYKALFNRPYRKTRREKKKERLFEMVCVNDPRYKAAEYNENSWPGKGARVELRFYNECKRRGLHAEINCDISVDIKINGYLVDVKGCYVPCKTHKSLTFQYHRYVFTKEQRKRCSFLACYHKIEKSFFIIPKEAWPGSNTIYISEHKTHYYNSKNRYWEYKNAWHLLEHGRLNKAKPLNGESGQGSIIRTREAQHGQPPIIIKH